MQLFQNNYIQNIDMEYVEEGKVKYFMMDDLNFDLIFNMTLYNECNIIKLNFENGATYEFIKSDNGE